LRLLLEDRQRENDRLREQSLALQAQLDRSATAGLQPRVIDPLSRPSSSASMRELAADMSNLQWGPLQPPPPHRQTSAFGTFPYTGGVGATPTAGSSSTPLGGPLLPSYLSPNVYSSSSSLLAPAEFAASSPVDAADVGNSGAVGDSLSTQAR